MSTLFKDLKTRNILSKEQMRSIRGGACGVQMCCHSCYKSSYCGGQNAGGQGLQDSFQTHVTHP